MNLKRTEKNTNNNPIAFLKDYASAGLITGILLS